MPKIIIGGIVLGEQRYTSADLWIRLLDGFRGDYMPTVQLWDALSMLLILHTMCELHKLGAKHRPLRYAGHRHATGDDAAETRTVNQDGLHHKAPPSLLALGRSAEQSADDRGFREAVPHG
jgi:hypothetical protein